jgi:tRNA U34 5-methylaminomethyl-2-thiouridine-forming methyltransferase MnmC
MKTEIRKTGDGSHTLFSVDFGEQYHSSFGAVQESQHIFIDAGLKFVSKQKNPANILEVGFGTGLNFLLTVKFALENNIVVNFTGIEAYLPQREVLEKLNYPEILGFDKQAFLEIFENKRGVFIGNTKYEIISNKIQEVNLKKEKFDLVYFDAFSPEIQPEMWSVKVFSEIYNSLKSNGVLTTYSCKGDVKRALKSVGFTLEKLPGPPGKREFLRAVKV